jgi:hypothetical protein
LGLFQKGSVLDLAKTVVRLTVHPNVWISNGAVGFLATSAKVLGSVHSQVLLYPVLRPFLLCETTSMTEQKILDFKQKPVSSGMFVVNGRFLVRCTMRRFLGRRKLRTRCIGNRSRNSQARNLSEVQCVAAEPQSQIREFQRLNLSPINLPRAKSFPRFNTV